MAELVDARDLKSLAHCERAGSSPAPGTTFDNWIGLWRYSQVAKAGACKALIPGSNPGVASIFIFHTYKAKLHRYSITKVSILSRI